VSARRAVAPRNTVSDDSDRPKRRSRSSPNYRRTASTRALRVIPSREQHRGLAGGSALGPHRREAFIAPADDLERLLFGCSILHCLPVGMLGEGAAGTGTVMRADTVRRYAQAAGFSDVDVLPIENDFYRYYRLTPQVRQMPDPQSR